jgi:hypothetical protein
MFAPTASPIQWRPTMTTDQFSGLVHAFTPEQWVVILALFLFFEIIGWSHER